MNNTVLVCDDAVFMRTIGDILTQAGLEVIGEADSGAQQSRNTRPSNRTW